MPHHLFGVRFVLVGFGLSELASIRLGTRGAPVEVNVVGCLIIIRGATLFRFCGDIHGRSGGIIQFNQLRLAINGHDPVAIGKTGFCCVVAPLK
jgi:hypothetical protein